MGLHEELAFLENLLEQQASIDEGLNTQAELDAYIQRMCVALEELGYEVPVSVELTEFLEGTSRILAEDAELTEEEGKHKSFLHKAVKAVKGAVSRGIANMLTQKQHDALRREHSAKADAALDAGDKKAYARHYVAKHFHLKHADPKKHYLARKSAIDMGDPEPGTKKAASMNWYLTRKTAEPHHLVAKANHAYQLKSAARKRAALAGMTGADSIPMDEPMSKSAVSRSALTATVKSKRDEEPTVRERPHTQGKTAKTV
jgi:hypothetical protein